MSPKPFLSFVMDYWVLLFRKTVQQAFWAAPGSPRVHAHISKVSLAECTGSPAGLTLPSMPSS